MHEPNREAEHLCYAVRKIKTGSGHSGEIVEVVKGQAAAEMTAERYKRQMTPEERAAGWRFSLERTAKRPPRVKAETRKKSANSVDGSPVGGSL